MEDLATLFRDQARLINQNGDNTVTFEQVKPTKKQCGIEGCSNVLYARGWCHKHHVRWKRFGDPTASLNTPKPKYRLVPCSWRGCTEMITVRSRARLCETHRHRFLNGYDMNAPIDHKRGRKSVVPGIPDDVRAGAMSCIGKWKKGLKPTAQELDYQREYRRLCREYRRSLPRFRRQVKALGG